MLKVVREDISQNAVHRVGKNFSSPWREIAGRKAILICLVSEKRAETAALIALLLEAGEGIQIGRLIAAAGGVEGDQNCMV